MDDETMKGRQRLMEDEKRIRESELFRQIRPYFDILQKTVPGYLFVTDMKEGLVLLSDSFTRDFDLPGTVLRDMEPHWRPLIHPDDLERYKESIEDVFEGRAADHDIEYRVRYRTGEYGWVNCHGIMGSDTNGEPFLWAGIIMPLDHVVRADTVTRLLNRYVLETVLSQELEREDASGVPDNQRDIRAPVRRRGPPPDRPEHNEPTAARYTPV